MIRQADYISAVKLMGASPWRIVLRHVMPLCVASVIVRVTLDMAGIIKAAQDAGARLVAPARFEARLVLPADADYDTLPLYVEKGEIRPRPETKAAEDVESEAYEQVHPDLVTGRHSMTVPAGSLSSSSSSLMA